MYYQVKIVRRIRALFRNRKGKLDTGFRSELKTVRKMGDRKMIGEKPFEARLTLPERLSA
jgi:hypothetical protein